MGLWSRLAKKFKNQKPPVKQLVEIPKDQYEFWWVLTHPEARKFLRLHLHIYSPDTRDEEVSKVFMLFSGLTFTLIPVGQDLTVKVYVRGVYAGSTIIKNCRARIAQIGDSWVPNLKYQEVE